VLIQSTNPVRICSCHGLHKVCRPLDHRLRAGRAREDDGCTRDTSSCYLTMLFAGGALWPRRGPAVKGASARPRHRLYHTRLGISPPCIAAPSPAHRAASARPSWLPPCFALGISGVFRCVLHGGGLPSRCLLEGGGLPALVDDNLLLRARSSDARSMASPPGERDRVVESWRRELARG
jgi:hypothetical protein